MRLIVKVKSESFWTWTFLFYLMDAYFEEISSNNNYCEPFTFLLIILFLADAISVENIEAFVVLFSGILQLIEYTN